MKNRVSATVSDQEVADVLAFLQQAEGKLNFLSPLTPEERSQLPKMGAKSRSFVEKAVEVAQQHPELLPRYVDPKEMAKDLELHRQLSKIFLVVSRLYHNIEDTMTLAGSEAYTASLVLYRTMQHLGKGSGLDDALDEMKQRFARSKGKEDDPTPSNPSSTPNT